MLDFSLTFQALTGNRPFPWQSRLYDQFVVGKFSKTASLPTGLGKTSIIAIWLIALANYPDMVPRRLVYVVNRRTVVDQTTDEVKKYRDALKTEEPAQKELWEKLAVLCAFPITDKDGQPIKDNDGKPVSPLAISTLRGQFADNREWSTDPARPAVICGTVDMIGSRLLFSGYGIGFKSKPLHAGFLGQDVLLIHDEAHLEQPFQQLLETIEEAQKTGEQTGDLPWKKLRVMELTATPRSEDDAKTEEPFKLDSEDEKHLVVRERLFAKKRLSLLPLKDAKKPSSELAEQALKFEGSRKAVLVFAQSVETVMEVREKLEKRNLACKTLTGTMRGLERDGLVRDPIFIRFLPESNRPKDVQTKEDTVYLICTSAGEVGVNISADHLVCDLSPFDSMAQRFGRVNRFAKSDDTTITVLYPTEFDATKPLDPRREKTLALLNQLGGDASPQALGKLHPVERVAAFTPPPVVLPATDILFDSWALTSITDKLPGRPPVEPYLHGIAGWEPPQTQVAWREEVQFIGNDLLREHPPEELLEAFPLKPHELLKDQANRVFERLKKLPEGQANPKLSVWVRSSEGEITPTTIGEIVAGDKAELEGVTLLLPPALGGLRDGMLNASSHEANDVSCEWFADEAREVPFRMRWRTDDVDYAPDKKQGWRLVRKIDLRPQDDDLIESDEEEVADQDEEQPRSSNPVLNYRYWYWYERLDHGDDPGGDASREAITWQHHTDDVTRNATKIADHLLKHMPSLYQALIVAARWHDLGKRRVLWQRSIGRPEDDSDTWYAKSDPRWPATIVRTKYRHEFGSLVDIQTESELQREFQLLPALAQQAVLHLIAVHHGYGRPHFSSDRSFDPDPRGVDTPALAQQATLRFADLQRRYGRWGLAYLESLLRAADAAASAHPTEAPQ